MSRSRKRNPITGICKADSEKKDKQIANKKFRRIGKEIIKNKSDSTLPKMREVSNVYDFAKDGKRYWSKEIIEKYNFRIKK